MVQTGRKWLPALVMGLFCGRLLSELAGATAVWLAGGVTLISVALAVVLLRQRPFASTWPLLFLSAYLVYPEINPAWAAMVAGVTAVAWASDRIPGNKLTGGGWGILPGLGFLLLYGYTIAPDVLPADSGEFQVVAAQLGIAHPPGFPLYTMLAHAATWLPLPLSPALKVNLLSALSSSLTLVVVYAITYRLTRRHLAAVTAVITLGSATTFWAQATTANIRSLTALFAALLLYALLRFWELRHEAKRRYADRWLILFALTLGWGLSHHVSLLFMGVVFALFVLVADPTIRRAPRRWAWPLLALLSGLIPLLYLPLRATSGARGATPSLATWQGFLDHVLARGFSGDFFYFSAPAVLWPRLQVMGNVLTFQFSPWLLGGMVAGLLWLLWQQRHVALLLGGSFLLHTLITATYRAPQTVEYMLPAYVPAAVVLGVAIGALLNGRFAHPSSPLRPVPQLISAMLLVTAVAQTIHHYPSYAALHQDTTARDYAQPLLAEAPAHAVILADWHWATPLWYLQEVEGQRPDVTIRFVYPEAAAYADTWAQRIAAELAAGRSAIATHYDEIAYRNLPSAVPLGAAFLYRQDPLASLPPDMSPLDVTLNGTIRLWGVRIARPVVEIGGETAVTLAWEPLSPLPAPVSLFAHVIGQDGRLVAQDDQPAAPQEAGITLTQFWLTPRPGAQPGPYTIGVGAYTAEPWLNTAGEARTAVATLALLPMSHPPYTTNPRHRPLVEGDRTLIGYDWDQTLPGQTRLYLHWQTAAGFVTEVRDDVTPQTVTLPPFRGAWGLTRTNWRLQSGWENGRYVPMGQGVVWLGDALTNLDSPLRLPQQLASSSPITRDLVLAVRLIGYQPDGFHWAWTEQEDGVPALGAIPTLKWIAGSRVRSPHSLSWPEIATPGQLVGATLRLYDAFTQRPLPILDERITNQFPWVPLGQLTWPED